MPAHHELSTWEVAEPVPPLMPGTLVRVATAAPMPGSASDELAVIVTMADDRLMQHGCHMTLRNVGGQAVVHLEVIGDIVYGANRQTATARVM